MSSSLKRIKLPWSRNDDSKLKDAIERSNLNTMTWTKVADLVPGRTPKQCRERYNKHHDDRSLL